MNELSRATARLVTTFCLALGLAILPSPCAAAAGDEDKGGTQVEFSDDHPLGEVEPDKALIYVLRPAKMGFAIKSYFLSDDEILGINKGRSYFFAHVEPGEHVFWSKSENVDALEMEVEAGGTYYLQQKVQMGGFRARTKLVVLDAAEGEAMLADCKKFATMTEKGRAKGEEIAREHRDATQKDLDRQAKKAKKGG